MSPSSDEKSSSQDFVRKLQVAAELPTDNSDSESNVRKSAWSNLSNGIAVADVSPVMGADSWPALSESAAGKIVPKSVALDPIDSNPKPAASLDLNHFNLISPNPNSTRQKMMKHGGGGGGGGGGSNVRLEVSGGPVSSPFRPLMDNPPPQIQVEKPRDMPNSKNSTNWDHGLRTPKSSGSSHGGPDHHRSFHRRSNNGGSGSGFHNGGRRDPDRGFYFGDWNYPPPPHYVPPPPHGPQYRPQAYVRTSPTPPPLPIGAAHYIEHSSPARPYVVSQMALHDFSSPYYYVPSPSPYVAPYPIPMPPSMEPTIIVNPVNPKDHYHHPILDQQVLKQIEYYFSDDNLCKDEYLRKQMDEQGWVLLSKIADFKRVKQLTKDVLNVIIYLVDVLRVSELLEVQGERIRKRGDWKRWLL